MSDVGPYGSGQPERWPTQPLTGVNAPPPPALLPVPATVAGGPGSIAEPVLITIGDVAVTEHHVITPNGTHPLRGTTWLVTDHTTTSEATPTYAIVLAMLFFLFCLLGLFFLFIKEKRVQGYVQLSIQGPGFYHVAQLPPGSGMQVNHQVAYVRNLVAARG